MVLMFGSSVGGSFRARPEFFKLPLARLNVDNMYIITYIYIGSIR